MEFELASIAMGILTISDPDYQDFTDEEAMEAAYAWSRAMFHLAFIALGERH